MLVQELEELEQSLIQVHWELMREAEELHSLKQPKSRRQVWRPTVMSNIEFYQHSLIDFYYQTYKKLHPDKRF